MENLPDLLSDNELKELEGQKRILYFNYLGNLNTFSNISENEILQLLNGKSHAIIDNHLYVNQRYAGYGVRSKHWLLTEEGKQYMPILKKMC